MKNKHKVVVSTKTGYVFEKDFEVIETAKEFTREIELAISGALNNQFYLVELVTKGVTSFINPLDITTVFIEEVVIDGANTSKRD